MKRIVIGADIVPTQNNIDMFSKGDMESVVGRKLLDFLLDDTYLICNLETPLTNNISPIMKCGPSFATTPSAINGIKALGVDLVSLANNHIKDQGTQGIITTCCTINESNIAYVGVGDNIQSASKPFYFVFNGKKIGVYSCVEHEYSAATEMEYGANVFDPLFTLDQISIMKEQCDYIIVLYHGGKEYYRLPSPYLQKVCRRIVEKGADLVICQHSHCLGAVEQYCEGTIIYGQGNFIFNKKDNEYWNSSVLVCIDERFDISYYPILRTDSGTRLADEEEGIKVLEEFHERSELVCSSENIRNEYNEFSKSIFNSYIAELSGAKSKMWQIANKISRGMLVKIIKKRKYSLKQLVKICNYIECEAHRELIINAIHEEIENR